MLAAESQSHSADVGPSVLTDFTENHNGVFSYTTSFFFFLSFRL